MKSPRLFTTLSLLLTILIAECLATKSQADDATKSAATTATKELPPPDLVSGAANELPRGALPGIQLPRALSPLIAPPAATYEYLGTPVSHPSPYYTLPRISLQPIYFGPFFNPTNSTGTSWVNYLNTYFSYIVRSSYLTSLSPYGISTGTCRSGLRTSATQPHYSSSNPVFLEDASIRATLTSWLRSGYLQPNDTFVVVTEPGVAVRFNRNNTQTSFNAFLGYHYWFTYYDSRNVYRYGTYIVLPFPGYPNYTPASSGFASYGDMLTSVASHEVAEASTDPYAGSYYGWTETIYKYVFATHQETVAFTKTTGEIGDAAVALFPALSQHGCRLNGYLMQKVIAPNGVSLITPSGAAHPGLFELAAQPVLQTLDAQLQSLGLHLPTP